MTRHVQQAGFTLLEVMIGLALLGLALTVLIKSSANSIFHAEQARMIGVATDLARGKMYDIEETLLKDGFSDTDQSQESQECFVDEGWPTICYSSKVEEPTLPSLDQLQEMAMGQAKAATEAAGSAAVGSAAGSAALGTAAPGFQNSMLGGMLGMFGASSGIDAAAGGSMISSQYSMFQEVLKVSVRKVTLQVKFKVLGADRDFKVVAFFTDPNAMNKTLLGQTTNMLGAQGGGAQPEQPAQPPTGGGGGGGGRGQGGGGRGGGP
jgi:general secretion pathway protein I